MIYLLYALLFYVKKKDLYKCQIFLFVLFYFDIIFSRLILDRTFNKCVNTTTSPFWLA